MTREELDEALVVGGLVLDSLVATLSGEFGRAQMEVRNAIGFLRASLATKLQAAAFGKPLFACFELAREAGATRIEMDKVRTDMLALDPVGLPGVAICVASVQMSLIEQAKIISATTFVSREDVDSMLATMNLLFDPAEEFAADVTDDPSVYQAMVSLHAAITKDLLARARPLPRVIQYHYTERMPSLVLANRIYGDGSRADELRGENKTVHPLFMQKSGRCLSN